MRAEEQKIIKTYLQEAYINLQEVRELNRQPRSERFPMTSKELACAQAVFGTLCNLAKNLDISNPWEDAEFNIMCVED